MDRSKLPEDWGRMRLAYGKQQIDQSDIEAVIAVLRGSHLTQGPAVETFELSLAEYVGAKYCATFSNATAALHCAVKSLQLPANAEGITSTNTFVASANCLAYNDLKPVFADIDPRTYNVTASSLASKINVQTQVIIPVHFAGQACDMEEIASLALTHNIKTIEDASHAIGSKYSTGERVASCKYSDLTVFSFHPVKTLTTGEGGAVTTNDPDLYKRLKLLRSHGITKEPSDLSTNPGPWYYEQVDLGFNYRLTDLQAALGTSQLRKLDAFKMRRSEIVGFYNEALADLPLLTAPYERPGLDSCFHLYVVRIDFEKLGHSRSQVMGMLAERGIGTQVHYIPVHTQPWYQKTFGYGWGDLTTAEQYYQKALSLPLYPAMTDEDATFVVKELKSLLKAS